MYNAILVSDVQHSESVILLCYFCAKSQCSRRRELSSIDRRAFHVEEIVGTKFRGGVWLRAGGQASGPGGREGL